jgi:hypothetical protein
MERFFNEPIMVDWCGDKCFPVVLIGTETMQGGSKRGRRRRRRSTRRR